MFRRVGRFLALIAVVASALNAECALSCSMRVLTGKTLPPGQTTEAASSAPHPCCPARKTLPSERNGAEKPCSDPMTIGEAAASALLQNQDAVQFLGLALDYRSDILMSAQGTPSTLAVDSRLRDLPSFSILRL